MARLIRGDEGQTSEYAYTSTLLVGTEALLELEAAAAPGAELGRNSRFPSATVCLLFPLLYGFIALHLGQDIGFDTLNYHFFDPYWLLHGHFLGIAPAQWQSYLDPLLNVPTYFLQSSLSARAASFTIATFEGLTFIPLYALSRRVTSNRVVAIGLAALGMLSAIAWSEIGTSFGDNIIAIFFISSVALVGRAVYRSSTGTVASWCLLAPGLLAGVAAGLKLTQEPIALGFLVAIPALKIEGLRRRVTTAWYFAGLAVGFAISYGYWGFELVTRYGNPVLPFFNNVFHSKFAPLAANLDTQSVAPGFIQWLFYPLLWAFDSHRVSVISFRELSLPICELLLWIAIVTRVYIYARRGVWQPMFSNQFERFLVLGSCASILIWAHLIGLYRYITSIEILGFVLLWILAGAVVRGFAATTFPSKVFNVLVASLCTLSVVTERPANWGRSAFSSKFFTVSVPKQFRRQGTALLMLTDNPYTYIVPFLPGGTDVIRLEPDSLTPYVDTLVRQRLHDATSIYITWTDATVDQFLRGNASTWTRYGLQVVDGSCSVFSTYMGSDRKWVHFCQVAPTTAHNNATSH